MLISQTEATELLKRSEDTLRRWRFGYYYRYDSENETSRQVWYYPDRRTLPFQKVDGVYYYDKEELLKWDNTLTARGPRLRHMWR